MAKEKITATEIYCDIYVGDKKVSSGPLAYFRTFSFNDLTSWVKRVCNGCLKTVVDKERETVKAFYDLNRTEVYTLREVKTYASNVYK